MANPQITDEIPRIESAYKQFMKRLILGAVKDAKTTLQDNKNYATNQLKQSINGDTNINGSQIIGALGANTKYAQSVEDGGNHSFTYQQAKAWATRKVQLGHISIPEKQIGTFAYFVSKKVQREGTKPHPYLRPAYEQLLSKFDAQTPLEIK
jgi:hypothetical protein